ncbi:DUF4188 domain-containing protein [Arthrobacter sp. Sa2CUA1]|uniref:DUF4188 domain-containing protein n=1 Tax=Arthrobacter gallicola TaxID=2762225 RepID=A0ABR8UMB3_9MICC|nr:DUF4188 domain-containing protein [Arthrobacter gallicola]MBD7993701.1 DUF4188 domain-containing protein [Arthrobacter gallicola]
MARIVSQRSTHHHTGPLVVFLIGMRINRPWRPDLWIPAFAAMPRMLAELSADPNSGLLGYRLTIGAGGPLVIQYWKSAEQLFAYASQPDAAHRPAWAAFNRRARRAPGSVGIWHETYVVDRAESMYVGMPVAGLAKATAAQLVDANSTAAARLGPATHEGSGAET